MKHTNTLRHFELINSAASNSALVRTSSFGNGSVGGPRKVFTDSTFVPFDEELFDVLYDDDVKLLLSVIYRPLRFLLFRLLVGVVLDSSATEL